MEDSQIVALYWARSEDAIAETEAKYGRACFLVAMRILCDERDAQESVNDTYLAAWNSIPPHKPQKLSPFLARITRRISIDRCRQKSAGKRGGGQTEAALEELEACIPAGNDPAASVDRIALTEILDGFLESLPADSRKIFLQRYWFFLPVSDIARESGYTQSKVKMTLLRARQKLREVLEKEGFV